MNLPSVNTLQRITGDGDRAHKHPVERITAQTLRSKLDCYRLLDWTADATLDACNRVLGGYGVEAIFGPDSCTRPVLLYINLGDTYDTTLLYEPAKDRFSVGSWGDYVERHNL